jgi:hypothetical protein
VTTNYIVTVLINHKAMKMYEAMEVYENITAISIQRQNEVAGQIKNLAAGLPRKNRRYPVDSKLVGSERRYGSCGEEKYC